jgi:homospermidine synthase
VAACLSKGGRAMADWPVHGNIDGPIGMIGFGSIGKGTLP